MTTRTEALAAARQRIVKDGYCPHCLRELVSVPDGQYGYCPMHVTTLYLLATGEVLGG